VAVLDHVDVTGGRPDPHPLGDTIGGNLIHWLALLLKRQLDPLAILSIGSPCKESTAQENASY
jgi:hypothetical protein